MTIKSGMEAQARPSEVGEGASRKLNVVAFGAHPDDIEISMSGLMLQLARGGHRSGWIVATDGAAEKGRADASLAAVRAQEAARAAEAASAELTMLGFADGTLAQDTGLTNSIAEVITAAAPDLVIVHAPNDYHPDHRALSRAVLDTAPVGTAILLADNMLGIAFEPRLLVDISPVIEGKLAVLDCHASQQPEQLKEMVGIVNRFRGLQSGPGMFRYAEAYATVPRPSRSPYSLLEGVVPCRILS